MLKSEMAVLKGQWKQLPLPKRKAPGRRGGARPGAGRPRKHPTVVPHTTRPTFKNLPVHVTLRVRPEIARLRRRKQHLAIRQSLRSTCLKPDFRIVHYSIQGNHLHLLCEASTEQALARGVQGFASSVARRINRTMGRTGKVFRERYHARQLRSPRQVRNALVYILNNWRKHDEHHDHPEWRTDPFSSADVFDGWSAPPTKLAARDGPTPVAPPTHFLLTRGWRRHHPPIDLRERPRAR
jgi:REP element-mobilizing transposase RayT